MAILELFSSRKVIFCSSDSTLSFVVLWYKILCKGCWFYPAALPHFPLEVCRLCWLSAWQVFVYYYGLVHAICMSNDISREITLGHYNTITLSGLIVSLPSTCANFVRIPQGTQNEHHCLQSLSASFFQPALFKLKILLLTNSRLVSGYLGPWREQFFTCCSRGETICKSFQWQECQKWWTIVPPFPSLWEGSQGYQILCWILAKIWKLHPPSLATLQLECSPVPRDLEKKSNKLKGYWGELEGSPTPCYQKSSFMVL